MSEFQMDMALEQNKNPLKDALNAGKFIFLAECTPQDYEPRREEAVERIMPLFQAMSKQEDLCGGLAITDKYGAPWSAAEIASAMPQEIRNRNLFYLSGCGRNDDAVNEQLNIFNNSGVENIVAVSGIPEDLTARECRMRNFCGSIEQLALMENHTGNFFAGSVFNPFHYEKNTVFASYYYLMDKVRAGSQFIVSQSGWDMLQNQTLSWYMLKNKIFLPMIAHLTLLSPDRMEKILEGKVPGVKISAPFKKLLERELSGSKAQFEAAQYRRLELQCAGCKLMGYSGVQIAGIDYPARAQIIAARIRSAIQEFKDFEHWLDEYNSHQATAEMETGLNSFHMYDRVLRRPYPFDEVPQISDYGELEFSWKEKFLFRLKKFLFANADKERPSRDFIMKKLFTGCRGCDKCTLQKNLFYCTKNCPMRLNNGPCGIVDKNGICPVSGNECIFVQKVRAECWLTTISCLE